MRFSESGAVFTAMRRWSSMPASIPPIAVLALGIESCQRSRYGMLSARLIQLIEENWEGITAATIRQIRSDPKLLHIRNLPETELREVGRNVLKNLGHWLTAN